eukprot:m.399943 g.399943  ORF g.399943 m.399943 type:complete len:283 (+) comp21156_c0_seq16:1013-1861(+)
MCGRRHSELACCVSVQVIICPHRPGMNSHMIALLCTTLLCPFVSVADSCRERAPNAVRRTSQQLPMNLLAGRRVLSGGVSQKPALKEVEEESGFVIVTGKEQNVPTRARSKGSGRSGPAPRVRVEDEHGVIGPPDPDAEVRRRPRETLRLQRQRGWSFLHDDTDNTSTTESASDIAAGGDAWEQTPVNAPVEGETCIFAATGPPGSGGETHRTPSGGLRTDGRERGWSALRSGITPQVRRKDDRGWSLLYDDDVVGINEGAKIPADSCLFKEDFDVPALNSK